MVITTSSTPDRDPSPSVVCLELLEQAGDEDAEASPIAIESAQTEQIRLITYKVCVLTVMYICFR